MTIIAFAFLLVLIKPSPFDTLCDAIIILFDVEFYKCPSETLSCIVSLIISKNGKNKAFMDHRL